MGKYKYNGVEYKSIGELKIAKFLSRNKINFEYEKEFKLKRKYDNSKYTMVYPDFYIPSKKIVIEYFGMEGDKNYDKETQFKKEIFEHNDYDLISIFPNTPQNMWEIEILNNFNKFSFKSLFQKIPRFDFSLPLRILISVLILFSLTFFLFDFQFDFFENGSKSRVVFAVDQEKGKLSENRYFVAAMWEYSNCDNYCSEGDEIIDIRTERYVRSQAILDDVVDRSWFCECIKK